MQVDEVTPVRPNVLTAGSDYMDSRIRLEHWGDIIAVSDYRTVGDQTRGL